MPRLSNFIKQEIQPFIREQVIPNDNRVSLRPGQSNAVIWKIAQKRRQVVLANVQAATGAITDEKLKSTISYGLLIKNNQGQWRILVAERGTNRSVEIVPEGQYGFVRTAQGFIRVNPEAGEANHRALSGHAERVRYAGMVHFRKNTAGEAVLDYWENASGGYQPEADRSGLAGLPQDRFRPLAEEKHIARSPTASPTARQPVVPQSPAPFALNAAAGAEKSSPLTCRLSSHREAFFNRLRATPIATPAPAIAMNISTLTNALTTVRNTPALGA